MTDMVGSFKILAKSFVSTTVIVCLSRTYVALFVSGILARCVPLKSILVYMCKIFCIILKLRTSSEMCSTYLCY